MQELILIQILLKYLINQIPNRRSAAHTNLECLGHPIKSPIRHNAWTRRKLEVGLINLAHLIAEAGENLERDLVGVCVVDATDDSPFVVESHACEGRAGGDVGGDDPVVTDGGLVFGDAREDEGGGLRTVVDSAFEGGALGAVVELGVWDVASWFGHGGCRGMKMS